MTSADLLALVERGDGKISHEQFRTWVVAQAVRNALQTFHGCWGFGSSHDHWPTEFVGLMLPQVMPGGAPAGRRGTRPGPLGPAGEQPAGFPPGYTHQPSLLSQCRLLWIMATPYSGDCDAR